MHELGDFTTGRRVIVITAIAIGIGVVAAYVAKGLLALIAFFTNLFYYGRFSVGAASPVGNHLGLFVIVIPVVGALIIGFMARYGSDRIRGHGIPEAIEAILINGSRIDAEGRGAEAALVRDLDRVGRPVRRRGADHHDRRRLRLADRAVLPPHRRRAQDAAGRRRRGRHVGDLRRTGGRGAARGRAAAVRVEAAQLHSGGAGQRHRRRRAPLHHRHRSAVSGAAASDLHRARRARRLRGRRTAGGRAVGAADLRRLRLGRRVSEAADSLDVVAGDRRPGHRRRRAISSRRRSASATTRSPRCCRAMSAAA